MFIIVTGNGYVEGMITQGNCQCKVSISKWVDCPIEAKNSYCICWNLRVWRSVWICWCYLFKFPKADWHVSKMTQAVTMLVDHCREKTLAVRGIGIVSGSLALCCRCSMWRVCGGSNLRAAIVWQVFWLLTKWVEANVHPKLRPVICVQQGGNHFDKQCPRPSTWVSFVASNLLDCCHRKIKWTRLHSSP